MDNQTTIRNDFDNIAVHAHETAPWDHNVHFYPFLLKHVPSDCGVAVDIGCGAGEFARLLARQAESVYGFDLAPKMIERARAFSQGYDNISCQVCDIGQQPLEENSIDCFVSIAAFHHIDYDEVLPKLKTALKPGGKIIILDLYRQTTNGQFVLNNLITLPLSTFHKWKYHVPPQTEEEELAWQEHERNDHFQSVDELRSIYNRHLPNNRLKVHLYWRYSMVWTKS